MRNGFRYLLISGSVILAGCAPVVQGMPASGTETPRDVVTAVEAVKKTFEERRVKYCPLDGKRYSPTMTICPVHGVELKDVSDPRQ